MNAMSLMEKIESLCKRRGFMFQGSEIYGGLAGTWDYGHLGNEMLDRIKASWWKKFVSSRRNMYGVRAAILMNPKVWEASGHVAGFSDPLVDCTKCKKRFREDQVETAGVCPECGGTLGESRQFNMMFKTHVGAVEDSASISYLRPETAQGIFTNFKNTVDAFHPKLPFGIAQIGKAFRNEITPRDFTFRSREFEQMEVEYFVRESEWQDAFEMWRNTMSEWISEIGIDTKKVHELEVPADSLAHYSKRTIDFEFDFPFGRKELFGLAYRTDFDLKAHGLEHSYLDEETKEKMTPHVIEPSLGVDRALLAVLLSAYDEDQLGGETRVVLRLKPELAPYRACVSPLLKNKPELVKKAEEVFAMLREKVGNVAWDDNGNIGKRYRRQDEIGTPYCVTIDFQTLDDRTVTVRDRDSGEQERFSIDTLSQKINA